MIDDWLREDAALSARAHERSIECGLSGAPLTASHWVHGRISSSKNSMLVGDTYPIAAGSTLDRTPGPAAADPSQGGRKKGDAG